MEISKKKRNVIIVILVFSVVLIVGLSLYLSLRNPYGNYLTISNLDEYTQGKPMDGRVLDWIKHALHTTVKLNTKGELPSNSIDDITVRDKSFSQTYSEFRDLHTVSFIVDSESIKQSYRVSYQWSNTNKYAVDPYGTQVVCLPIDELIYGDFNCIDDRILEHGKENYDPVAKILPYHVVDKYTITDYKVDPELDGVTLLIVEAYPSRGDITVPSNVLAIYTKEINAWLVSRKLDPSKYRITYGN